MRAPTYTDAEDRIIIEHYSKVGAKGCMPMLPGRPRRSIVERAKKLGQTYAVWLDMSPEQRKARAKARRELWRAQNPDRVRAMAERKAAKEKLKRETPIWNESYLLAGQTRTFFQPLDNLIRTAA